MHQVRKWRAFLGLAAACLLLAATTPALAQGEKKEVVFVGVGLMLDQKPTPEGGYTILNILPAADAETRRTVEKGDVIVQVDGKPTKGKSNADVVKAIRGPEGSTVRLTLQRKGAKKPIEVTVKRRSFRAGE